MRFLLILAMFFYSCHSNSQSDTDARDAGPDLSLLVDFEKIKKSDEEWKAELGDLAYYALREAGKERPFTGKFWDNKKPGIYTCGGCGLPLFDAVTKFKSGTGWPSFYEPISKKVVDEDVDYKVGYKRTEVLCARCDGHLGHVFADDFFQLLSNQLVIG